MKAIRFLVAFILIFFIFTAKSFAVTVSVTNFPTTLSDQPFAITASVSGATAGTNYLRIDLYKDGTSNYFGETYNGSSWYSGGEGSSYFPITIDSSKNGFGTFQGRVGNPNSNDYPGPGNYKLKIRRYTSSGSLASSDTQTPVDVNITYAAPTSSPTPTVTPAPTPTEEPTSTNTPTPTLKLVLTPTAKLTKTPTSSEVSTNSAVLGQSVDNAINDNNSKKMEVASISENVLPKIFIGLGIIFFVACAAIIVYPYMQKFKEERFGNDK